MWLVLGPKRGLQSMLGVFFVKDPDVWHSDGVHKYVNIISKLLEEITVTKALRNEYTLLLGQRLGSY